MAVKKMKIASIGTFGDSYLQNSWKVILWDNRHYEERWHLYFRKQEN